MDINQGHYYIKLKNPSEPLPPRKCNRYASCLFNACIILGVMLLISCLILIILDHPSPVAESITSGSKFNKTELNGDASASNLFALSSYTERTNKNSKSLKLTHVQAHRKFLWPYFDSYEMKLSILYEQILKEFEMDSSKENMDRVMKMLEELDRREKYMKAEEVWDEQYGIKKRENSDDDLFREDEIDDA